MAQLSGKKQSASITEPVLEPHVPRNEQKREPIMNHSETELQVTSLASHTTHWKNDRIAPFMIGLVLTEFLNYDRVNQLTSIKLPQ